jgi:hypothetical protein
MYNFKVFSRLLCKIIPVLSNIAIKAENVKNNYTRKESFFVIICNCFNSGVLARISTLCRHVAQQDFYGLFRAFFKPVFIVLFVTKKNQKVFTGRNFPALKGYSHLGCLRSF